jgi:uncharacterized repeat protein (TIGR01451 family)
MLRRCARSYVGLIAFAMMCVPAWGQNFVTGANTGSEAKLDNNPDNVTFTLNVTGGGTYSFGGGIFFLKDGTITTGTVTLKVFNSSNSLLGTVTLTNAQFCSGFSNCQSYAYHTFALASPLALAAGSYSLQLSSTATPQQNDAYFVKGGGAVFNVSTTGGSAPDVTVSKSATPTSFTLGNSATYNIQVSNVGSGPTTGTITVVDTLDANTSFLSAVGGVFSCGNAGQVVTCTTSSVIAAGAFSPISITVSVLSNGESTVTNNVTVSGGGDSNAGNNTFQLVSPAASPNLTVTKSVTPTTFTPGGSAAYSIQVTNTGSAATSGTITVVDTLDANLAYVSASGTGWTCGIGGSTVTCTSTTILAGGGTVANPITINTTVRSNGELSITNNVSVSGGGEAASLNDTFQLISPVTAPAPTVPISNWPTLLALGAASLFFLTRKLTPAVRL